VKRKLERIEIPGEHDARVRAWDVVRAAYAEREPVSRPLPFLRPLLAAAVAAALVAAALSPPGQAVVDSVRKAIGVESAEQALFSLPAPGRVLVGSDSGVWVVSNDGSKRRLGDYREASWSPFGRFVVAARQNELATLEPDGDLHWKLSRREVRLPRWGGSRIDTRIAYLSDGAMRVVGGDGRGDHTCASSGVASVAGAWRPTARHVLAFVASGDIVYVYAVDRCERLWKANGIGTVRSLAWSPDGSQLLVQTADGYVVFSGSGRELVRRRLPGIVAAAYAPDGRLAVIRTANGRSELRFGARNKSLLPRFAGPGTFTDLAWSTDGRWVLVAWREPDQWLFVSASGRRRARAVANVSRQFDSRSFPTLEGWGPPVPGEP
jgi:WD40 repeat protein